MSATAPGLPSALHDAPTQPLALQQRLTTLSRKLQAFRTQVAGVDSLQARVIAEALDLLFDIVRLGETPP